MFNIEVKSEVVEQRFDAMMERVKTFAHEEMPQGLTDWQTEDMRRKYPETATEATGAMPNDVSASTMIYPRSRTYEATHPHRAHPVAKRKAVLSSMPLLRKSAMQHPILRQELFDKLVTRMSAMLSQIKW
jgi:hypothetical protein